MKKILQSHVLFILILFTGLVLRLYNIDMPLLDQKPNREIHTAEETRNLYYDPSTLFYPTAKLWADEPGYYIVEFPIYNSLVAVFYTVFGGVNETWGRIVSVIASIGVAVYFYRLVNFLYNKRVAVWTVVFMFLVSPQEIILSRNFQPDQLGLFFGICALYYFTVWTKNNKLRHFLISWFCLSLTFLIKISFFPFIFPMLFLAYKKYGFRLMFQTSFVIFLTSILPTLLWYYHVRAVYLLFPMLHSASLVSPQDWLTFGKLLDIHWIVNVIYDFTDQVITIPGALLFLLSTIIFNFRKHLFVYIWLTGVIVYALLFIGKIHFWYYQVPFIFPMSILIGLTIVKIMTVLPTKKTAAFIYLTAIVGLLMILTGRPYILRTYSISPRHESVVETGDIVKKLAPHSGKIVASSYNSAALTYYALRKDMWGATLLINDESCADNCALNQLEAAIKWGATIYAVSDKKELDSNRAFDEHLRKKYVIAKETEKYIVFDLIQAPVSPATQ